MAIKDVLSNAKYGKRAYEELEKEKLDEVEKFKKFFHIRPKTGGFTIVSTHPERPMNGIKVPKTKLKGAIIQIAQSIEKDKIDWERAKINSKEFHISGKSKGEYRLQANFINTITKGNKQLNNILGVNNLYLIGSEMILQENTTKGGNKPDVVAIDDNGRVLLFELKTSKNKVDDPKTQVEKYTETYEKNERYERLILNYPMTKIDNINKYEGWIVRGNKDIEDIIKIQDNYIEIPEK